MNPTQTPTRVNGIDVSTLGAMVDAIGQDPKQGR